MDIPNPRRVLAVSLDSQVDHLSRVIKDLTGSAPTSSSASLAGTTHDLALRTQYYKATVPVWLDLVGSPTDWAASFLSEEAREVLAVLGGLIVVFSLPAAAEESAAQEARDLVRQVGRVVCDGLGGWEWDGVRLAVGVGEGTDAEEWDELCAEAGMEFVQVGARPQQPDLNEFGEKTGIARVREALEANDWAQGDAASALSDFGEFETAQGAQPDDGGKDLDPESLDFGFDRADFEGLKKAIWTSGQEHDDNVDAAALDVKDGKSADREADDAGKQVQQGERSKDDDGAQQGLDDDDVIKVEQMMRKLQAVRDAGAGLGEAQRRKMAAKAVAEVMREL